MLINEQEHEGAFLLSEADGFRSRDTGTVASGQNLRVGTVLTYGSNGKYTAYTGDATRPAAVLYRATDASNADTKALVIARKAEVNGSVLVWPDGYTSQQIRNAVEVLKYAGITVK